MNCERCRVRMADAAAGADAISTRLRPEMEAHIEACTNCREEFARVQKLLETIDRGVVAQAASEPTPELIARVQRRIAEEAASRSMTRAKGMRGTWVPVAACAALAIVAAAAWFLPPRSGAPRIVSGTMVTIVKNPPAGSKMGEGSKSGERCETGARAKPLVAEARRAEVRRARRIEREASMPEVLVQPGQMRALLQLEAALRSGKLNGAEVSAALRNDDKPLEIKPLVISPLDSAETQSDTAQKSSEGAGSENFVDADSGQGKLK